MLEVVKVLNELKGLSDSCNTKEMDKKIISIYHEYDNQNIEFGCVNNFIDCTNEYEIYIFVNYENICVSNILSLITKDRKIASETFNKYKKIVERKDIYYLREFVINSTLL